MSKKQASAKLDDIKRCEVRVKHQFTVEEYQEKTQHLTSQMKNVELREEAIKASAATAKAEVKAMKAEVNELANQLRNGFEERVVNATVEFNAKRGVKSFFHFCPENRDLHKTFIREEAMAQEDYEQELPGMPEKVTTAQPPPEAKPEQQQAAGEEGEPV